MDPAVLPILQCPRCRTAEPFAHLRNPRCSACGLEPQGPRGFLDLIDVAVGGEPTAPSTEQRLMESDLVARVYDRVWRPSFVRLLAGKGAGAAVGGLSGELFIHKHSLSLDDRPGPWLDLSCGPGAFVRAFHSINAAAARSSSLRDPSVRAAAAVSSPLSSNRCSAAFINPAHARIAGSLPGVSGFAVNGSQTSSTRMFAHRSGSPNPEMWS